MMFTEGVRKIFSHPDCIQRKNVVEKAAMEAGYSAFSFNNQIYILDADRDKDPRIIHPWVRTCFLLTDFAANPE